MEGMIRSLKWALEWREMSPDQKTKAVSDRLSAIGFYPGTKDATVNSVLCSDNARCSNILTEWSELWFLLSRSYGTQIMPAIDK